MMTDDIVDVDTGKYYHRGAGPPLGGQSKAKYPYSPSEANVIRAHR